MTSAKILLVLAFLSCAPTHAQAQDTEGEAHNKALVQRSFDAWKAGTGSPFDLLAGEASWTITGNSVASKTYPTVLRLRGQDSIVIYFDADGTARDGKPYHNSYAWFFDLRNDKVVRAVAFFDSVEFNAFWKRVKPASPSR